MYGVNPPSWAAGGIAPGSAAESLINFLEDFAKRDFKDRELQNTFGNLVGTLTGYRAQPALMSLLVYIGYWVVVSLFLKRAAPKSTAQAKLAT